MTEKKYHDAMRLALGFVIGAGLASTVLCFIAKDFSGAFTCATCATICGIILSVQMPKEDE